MNTFFVMFVRVAGLMLMILAGYAARKKEILNEASTRALSLLLMTFIYPASIYSSIVGSFTLPEILHLWKLPVFEAMIMLIGFLAAIPLLFVFSKHNVLERRMFHYQCTLMNFIFMPLPLVLMLLGERGVALLSLAFIGGESTVWTLGVLALSGGLKLNQLKKIFNMPFIAILLGLGTLVIEHFCPFMKPSGDTAFSLVTSTLLTVLKSFGGATVGISMVVAGSGMATLELKSILSRFNLTIASMRLLVIPLIAIGVLHLLPLEKEPLLVLSIVAMMPSSVSSVAYARALGGDVDTASAAILLTHLGCLFTAPLFYSIFC